MAGEEWGEEKKRTTNYEGMKAKGESDGEEVAHRRMRGMMGEEVRLLVYDEQLQSLSLAQSFFAVFKLLE